MPRNYLLLTEHPEILNHDTVGAVAIDSDGNVAAAASTGGLTMKLPGRIGDTPIIGAGLYADNSSGAVTVTGTGEVAIKLVLSESVCSLMKQGFTALEASIQGVTTASKRLKGDAGIIAIDTRGRVAAVQNCPYMPYAVSTAKQRKPKVSLRGKTVAQLF
jgi:beta-aspartyl-peptidase (threonine type)